MTSPPLFVSHVHRVSFSPSCLHIYPVHPLSSLQHHFQLSSITTLLFTFTFIHPVITHLTSASLFHSPSHFPWFVVSPSKQGILKLLIIIPGHEMVGRLCCSHIASKVWQHTIWAALTEQPTQGSRRPQNGSIMENGSRVAGRLLQRPKKVDIPLTDNREHGETCSRHYWVGCHTWKCPMWIPHGGRVIEGQNPQY